MDEKIAEVCGIAGCTEEKAKFFLESTNGDVALAVNAFFGASNLQSPLLSCTFFGGVVS